MNNYECQETIKAEPQTLGARFALSGGSFAGPSHRALGRNNQDAWSAVVQPDLLCAVVTDGCGSGAHSEVGAHLGARWLATHLPVCWRQEWSHAPGPGSEPGERVARAANAGLADALGRILHELGPATSRSATVRELGLFTWLAAVVDERRWAVMGLGDGLFAVDGEVTELEAGDDNAPDYVGYRLVPPGTVDGAPHLEGRLLAWGRTDDLGSLLVGTDGVAALRSVEPAEGAPTLRHVAYDAAVRRNPSLIAKRLRVAAEEHRVLNDDTTLAVIHRRTP